MFDYIIVFDRNGYGPHHYWGYKFAFNPRRQMNVQAVGLSSESNVDNWNSLTSRQRYAKVVEYSNSLDVPVFVGHVDVYAVEKDFFVVFPTKTTLSKKGVFYGKLFLQWISSLPRSLVPRKFILE